MKTDFDYFVGIDWSGDKCKSQKGLKVAVADPGHGAPRLISGPRYRDRWSRCDVAHWIVQLAKRKRALIGLDFAFGFPATDLSPTDICFNWEYVEKLCSAADNFYGGEFFRSADMPHSHLVNSPWLPRKKYSANHLRVTDFAASQTKGARPQSVFNAIGAAQVGPSSISGMRMLKWLSDFHRDKIRIWPFDALNNDTSILVEIFPRYFPLSRNLSARLAEHKILNIALNAFGSKNFELAPQSEDEGDALLSAAALRCLSKQNYIFDFPNSLIRSEGWIFGVPIKSGKTP